jgi:hypothetical protein
MLVPSRPSAMVEGKGRDEEPGSDVLWWRVDGPGVYYGEEPCLEGGGCGGVE